MNARTHDLNGRRGAKRTGQRYQRPGRPTGLRRCSEAQSHISGRVQARGEPPGNRDPGKQVEIETRRESPGPAELASHLSRDIEGEPPRSATWDGRQGEPKHRRQRRRRRITERQRRDHLQGTGGRNRERPRVRPIAAGRPAQVAQNATRTLEECISLLLEADAGKAALGQSQFPHRQVPKTARDQKPAKRASVRVRKKPVVPHERGNELIQKRCAGKRLTVQNEHVVRSRVYETNKPIGGPLKSAQRNREARH